MEAGRGKASEVGRQAGELMSFFEDAPVPLLLASGPWDPAHHFLSKLALTVAQYLCPVFSNAVGKFPAMESSRETTHIPPPPFFLSLKPGAASPGLSRSVPCILEYPH